MRYVPFHLGMARDGSLRSMVPLLRWSQPGADMVRLHLVRPQRTPARPLPIAVAANTIDAKYAFTGHSFTSAIYFGRGAFHKPTATAILATSCYGTWISSGYLGLRAFSTEHSSQGFPGPFNRSSNLLLFRCLDIDLRSIQSVERDFKQFPVGFFCHDRLNS